MDPEYRALTSVRVGLHDPFKAFNQQSQLIGKGVEPHGKVQAMDLLCRSMRMDFFMEVFVSPTRRLTILRFSGGELRWSGVGREGYKKAKFLW